MNRLQEQGVEQLALHHGRVHVRDGFADGIVRATVPSTAHFLISENGIPQRHGVNASIDWSYE